MPHMPVIAKAAVVHMHVIVIAPGQRYPMLLGLFTGTMLTLTSTLSPLQELKLSCRTTVPVESPH